MSLSEDSHGIPALQEHPDFRKRIQVSAVVELCIKTQRGA